MLQASFVLISKEYKSFLFGYKIKVTTNIAINKLSRAYMMQVATINFSHNKIKVNEVTQKMLLAYYSCGGSKCVDATPKF